jgi:hypothetical protein
MHWIVEVVGKMQKKCIFSRVFLICLVTGANGQIIYLLVERSMLFNSPQPNVFFNKIKIRLCVWHEQFVVCLQILPIFLIENCRVGFFPPSFRSNESRLFSITLGDKRRKKTPPLPLKGTAWFPYYGNNNIILRNLILWCLSILIQEFSKYWGEQIYQKETESNVGYYW